MKLSTTLLAGASALLLTAGAASAATLVAEADLHVRSGPGTQYPVIATIPQGGAVHSSECGAGWCRVDYRGQRGWASRAYLGGGGSTGNFAYETSTPAYGGYYGYDTPYDEGVGSAFVFGVGPSYYRGYGLGGYGGHRDWRDHGRMSFNHPGHDHIGAFGGGAFHRGGFGGHGGFHNGGFGGHGWAQSGGAHFGGGGGHFGGGGAHFGGGHMGGGHMGGGHMGSRRG
jgi:hypothetical protein